MSIALDWLGCATFRLSIDGLIVYLDTFVDRPSGAPAVGVTTADISEADFALIGHSHWDHLAGADIVAKNTGAIVIGSHESARVLAERGVPSEQLWPSGGGEHYRLNDAVTVRVLPSLHSCIWSRAAPPGVEVTGDYGVTEDERNERMRANRSRRGEDTSEAGAERRALIEDSAHSNSHGGALDYLIETSDGNVLFQDSMGYWTGLYANIPVDYAVLAAAGRGNIDGEPVQGSVEQFVVRECELLRPRTVVLGHHDNFTGAPDVADVADLSPVYDELARVLPNIEVKTVELGASLTLVE